MPDTDPADATPAPERPALSPAASFEAWWQATIPDSAISRDTDRYNRLFALKQQILPLLEE
ncbi:hypothetical protein [Phaeospirillum tilakii]|uniref:Uncharacterized protein n=1 Tax=Phaeospirillum tilakii TaxID=741673 RepID=A0ABW5CEJ5_9PROT